MEFKKLTQVEVDNMLVQHKLFVMLGNGWYIFLVLIPFVGPMISSALVMFGRYRLSVAFGHGLWFAVGLAVLNPIFMLILGFDDSVFNPELMPADPE